jgi:sugar/nucleoside kinase (ribokinase family)
MSSGSAEFDFDLVTVGSACVDYIHRVSMLPRSDDGVAILDRRIGPGGVDTNVAAAAAKLGLRVGIIAHVGSDAAGQMILDDLRQRGVDVSRMQVGGEDDTAYTMIFVDANGDRMMMTGGLGVRGLTLDDADDAYVRRARVCFVSAYLPWPLLQRVANVCAEPGGPALAFDLPGPFEDLEARGFERTHLDALIPSIGLFLTGRESLRSYTGEDTLPAGLKHLHDKGVRQAAVSDGARGLTLFTAEGGLPGMPTMYHVPVVSVPVVDTTGAGDVLHAALIAEWLIGGRSAPAAGSFAAAAAALSCQGWGVRAALPTRAEAEALAGTKGVRVIG